MHTFMRMRSCFSIVLCMCMHAPAYVIHVVCMRCTGWYVRVHVYIFCEQMILSCYIFIIVFIYSFVSVHMLFVLWLGVRLLPYMCDYVCLPIQVSRVPTIGSRRLGRWSCSWMILLRRNCVGKREVTRPGRHYRKSSSISICSMIFLFEVSILLQYTGGPVLCSNTYFFTTLVMMIIKNSLNNIL